MSYISEVIEQTELKNPNQPQFMQTVKEVLTSLAPAIEQNEQLMRKTSFWSALSSLTDKSCSAFHGWTTTAIIT